MQDSPPNRSILTTQSGCRRARALCLLGTAMALATTAFTNAGDGLSVVIFDNPDFTGPSVTRIDSAVDFDWGGGSPASGIGADSFSARWAGSVTAVEAGSYTFRAVADDGVRLWVDDQLVIDRWIDQGPTAWEGTISLQAGRSYHIVMEYYENGGGAVSRLQWKRPGQASYVTVPQSQLSSDDRIFPANSGIVNVKDYGAQGNGIADDWWPIQRAISDHLDGSKVIYFPNGTYRISKTLFWRHFNNDQTPKAGDWSAGWGAYLILRGQNRDNTVIRLANNVFTSPPSYESGDFRPNAVIYTASRDDQYAYSDTNGEGNQGFANSLYDLTISTGSGNSGAVGINYVASNWGVLRNVRVKSDDSGKIGDAGIRMTRRDNGPASLSDVSVSGFDYGIACGDMVTTATFEHIRLDSQRVAGFWTTDAALSIRGLISRNRVPGMVHRGLGLTALIDSSFFGGAPENAAIDNEEGNARMFVRNVTTTGYGNAVRNRGTNIAGNAIAEWTSEAPLKKFADSANTSVNLPIKETPSYFDRNHANWAFVGSPNGSDDTAAIQAAMNSGKSTVYFQSGAYYRIKSTITVPASVAHVLGMEATLQAASGHSFGDGNNPQPVFRVTGGTATATVIWEQFKNEVNEPGAIGIQHSSPRTLAIKDAIVGGGKYSAQAMANAGDVCLDDVVGGIRLEGTTKAWARSLNSESAGDPRNYNNGGKLWILNIKTEGSPVVIETRNGGETELLGGLLYPTHAPATNTPAFLSINSRMSLTYATVAFSQSNDYWTQVQETRNSATVTLTRDETFWRGWGHAVPLYIGYTGSGGSVANGTYKLINKNSGKALDVAGVSTTDGAAVHQWGYVGGNNQKWSLEALSGSDEGCYKITALHSGKVLDVAGVSTADGAMIHQLTYLGGENQKWRVEDVGGGYHRLTAKHSGKVVAINGGSTADGAVAIQWPYGFEDHKWQLLPP